MAAEIVKSFEALEAQAQVLMSVFTKAGHEAVAPAIIQPADVFLDVIGESLRARTYVFTDPEGAELCLRPDLTVPACRLHIARNGDLGRPAKYCYNGPAFRFQPQSADAAHPREFRQAGIERFSDAVPDVAEAETVALIVKAIEAAGLKQWSMHTGDLGLFRVVLDAVQLPARWQKRLIDAFNRPGTFRSVLKQLTTSPGARSQRVPPTLLAKLVPGDTAASETAVLDYLDSSNIELIGNRTAGEMTEHLLDIIADREAKPLDAAKADLIARYVSVSGPILQAGTTITAMLKDLKNGPGAALDAYDRRVALLANAGIDLNRVTFSAEFGRALAYYSGFVFEILALGSKADGAIAGGGRYDGLMRAAGALRDIPAVGAAIHTERLLAATTAGQSPKSGER